MSFIPKDYDKIATGDYMNKFENGPNRIRILDGPITGYEYWVDSSEYVRPRDQKIQKGDSPVRDATFDDFTVEQRNAMRPFLAAVIWNYQAEKVQVMQIKQITIMRALEALALSESWGDVRDYDIVVTRTKTGNLPTDVEYSVMPEPKAALIKEIKDSYDSDSIRLEALYAGEDPFDREMPAAEGDPISNEDLDAMAKELDAKEGK